MSQYRDLEGSIGEPNLMSAQRDLAVQCAREHCVLLAVRVKVIRHNESGLDVEKIQGSALTCIWGQDVGLELSSHWGAKWNE